MSTTTRDKRYVKTLAFVSKHISKKSKILDLGTPNPFSALLKEKGFDVSIIFSGNEHPSTERIIKKMTNVPVIGRINEEPYFDKNVIKEYANKFKDKL